MIEIKFVGRGGQGGKSAAAILAEAALDKGKNIQSFPEFGAERQGAPVFAYTRIDDKEIRIHSGVTNPDFVVVLDPTLIGSIPITNGLSDKGILVVNTPKNPDAIREIVRFEGDIYTVDATKISVELFGRNIPNTPMLGAVEKVASLVGLDSLKEKIREKFERKIGEEGVNRNLEAIERAFNEVRKE